MTTPTPAEQIQRFVEQHPGEWRAVERRNYDGAMALQTAAGWLVLRPFVLFVSVTASHRGYDDHEFTADGADERAPILAQAAARIADVCSAYAVPAKGLPPWLADPVRRELRRRAGELLTLAGSSPADVVSAAETLDEYLAARPPVPMDAGAICNALMEIGMSCRWVANTAVNPEREALQDARVALAATDDAMTRAQLLDLAANLRRVLGVTP